MYLEEKLKNVEGYYTDEKYRIKILELLESIDTSLKKLTAQEKKREVKKYVNEQLSGRQDIRPRT